MYDINMFMEQHCSGADSSLLPDFVSYDPFCFLFTAMPMVNVREWSI